jgi:hypothetical protein
MIGLAKAVAVQMLFASLVLSAEDSSADEVKRALTMIQQHIELSTRVESRTLLQAFFISAIQQAAAWVRAGYSGDDAAAGELAWSYLVHASNDGGSAFGSAVEAWLGKGAKRRWDAVASALRSAGIQTSAANARKVWQRHRLAHLWAEAK